MVMVYDKPNIFTIATKELSQDAFITWLMQWADEKYSATGIDLSFIGQSFVKFLISTKFDVNSFEIKKVEAGRQWENIDIWADVNEEYLIIIEDKTETNEHDNQLERYVETASGYYGSSRKIVPVYLKTGLEDINIGVGIQKRGWYYCDRTGFLGFLLSHMSTNDIYNDFVSCLNQKNEEAQSFIHFDSLNSWEATKGLFVWLQHSITEWTQWDYVPNQSGGFLGFWFHFVPCIENSNQQFYLQIENYCENKCNLYIKICGEWERSIEYLYEKLEILKSIAQKHDLTISKPSRYRIGEYTSLATIEDVFISDNNALDLCNLIDKMRTATLLVDELANYTRE